MKANALKWCITLAMVAVVLFTGGWAYAQQVFDSPRPVTVGAVNPANGYPKMYKDGNGLRLAPCLTAGAADPCGLIAAGALPNPAGAVVFPGNFPSEFFYARLASRINGINAGAGRADLTLAVLGSFAGGIPPTAGQQVVFSRYRVRVTAGLTPGALYTVTTPYGTNTFVASAAGTINFTNDVGCLAAPCNFASVLAPAPGTPFLTWNPVTAAPVGFIGNPAVTNVITAGAAGAVFSIAGPNVGTAVDVNRNFTQTDQFTVAGQIFIPPATTTTLTTSPNPSGPGQAVTLTATVRPVPPATGVADGTVTFKDGATVLGTTTLNAAGVATFSISTLAGGAHSLTAAYSGSDNFAASTSAAVIQNVRSAASTTSIVSSQNPIRRRNNVTFTATVRPVAPAVTTPTGTVTFRDGATVLGTATLNAAGVASFSTTRLEAGTHPITGTYNGDITFGGSVSPVLNQVITN